MPVRCERQPRASGRMSTMSNPTPNNDAPVGHPSQAEGEDVQRDGLPVVNDKPAGHPSQAEGDELSETSE